MRVSYLARQTRPKNWETNLINASYYRWENILRFQLIEVYLGGHIEGLRGAWSGLRATSLSERKLMI